MLNFVPKLDGNFNTTKADYENNKIFEITTFCVISFNRYWIWMRMKRFSSQSQYDTLLTTWPWFRNITHCSQKNTLWSLYKIGFNINFYSWQRSLPQAHISGWHSPSLLAAKHPLAMWEEQPISCTVPNPRDMSTWYNGLSGNTQTSWVWLSWCKKQKLYTVSYSAVKITSYC